MARELAAGSYIQKNWQLVIKRSSSNSNERLKARKARKARQGEGLRLGAIALEG